MKETKTRCSGINVGIYRIDFKVDDEGNNYFDFLLEQLAIPVEQQKNIEEIELTVTKYEVYHN